MIVNKELAETGDFGKKPKLLFPQQNKEKFCLVIFGLSLKLIDLVKGSEPQIKILTNKM